MTGTFCYLSVAAEAGRRPCKEVFEELMVAFR
jgi:hypothetical protein